MITKNTETGCNIGCGCGRNRKTRIAKGKAAHKQKQKLSVRLTAASKQSKERIRRKKLIEKKVAFCKYCTHSTPTKVERKRKIRVCHKTNISVQSILNKPNFKCPIGNF